jgi:hypothetical protein
MYCATAQLTVKRADDGYDTTSRGDAVLSCCGDRGATLPCFRDKARDCGYVTELTEVNNIRGDRNRLEALCQADAAEEIVRQN